MRGQTQERPDAGIGMLLRCFMVTRPTQGERDDERALTKHIQKLLVDETRSRQEHDGRIRRIMEALYQRHINERGYVTPIASRHH